MSPGSLRVLDVLMVVAPVRSSPHCYRVLLTLLANGTATYLVLS